MAFGTAGVVIIGLGIDVVAVERIGRVLAAHGQRFLARCFAPEEVRRPTDAQHVAGLFAAKEAGLKALGTGWGASVSWHDLAVTHDPAGAPRLALRGAALRHAEREGATSVHVSITHAAGVAVAVVIIEK